MMMKNSRTTTIPIHSPLDGNGRRDDDDDHHHHCVNHKNHNNHPTVDDVEKCSIHHNNFMTRKTTTTTSNNNNNNNNPTNSDRIDPISHNNSCSSSSNSNRSRIRSINNNNNNNNNSEHYSYYTDEYDCDKYDNHHTATNATETNTNEDTDTNENEDFETEYYEYEYDEYDDDDTEGIDILKMGTVPTNRCSLEYIQWEMSKIIFTYWYRRLRIVLIVLICFLLGLRTCPFVQQQEQNTIYQTMIHHSISMYQCIFTIELIMELSYWQQYTIKNPWLVFDLFLFTLILYWTMVHDNFQQTSASFLILRSIRFLRTIRKSPHVQHIIHCLTHVVPQLFWITILCCIPFYMFTVLCTNVYQNQYQNDTYNYQQQQQQQNDYTTNYEENLYDDDNNNNNNNNRYLYDNMNDNLNTNTTTNNIMNLMNGTTMMIPKYFTSLQHSAMTLLQICTGGILWSTIYYDLTLQQQQQQQVVAGSKGSTTTTTTDSYYSFYNNNNLDTTNDQQQSEEQSWKQVLLLQQSSSSSNNNNNNKEPWFLIFLFYYYGTIYLFSILTIGIVTNTIRNVTIRGGEKYIQKSLDTNHHTHHSRRHHHHQVQHLHHQKKNSSKIKQQSNTTIKTKGIKNRFIQNAKRLINPKGCSMTQSKQKQQQEQPCKKRKNQQQQQQNPFNASKKELLSSGSLDWIPHPSVSPDTNTSNNNKNNSTNPNIVFVSSKQFQYQRQELECINDSLSYVAMIDEETEADDEENENNKDGENEKKIDTTKGNTHSNDSKMMMDPLDGSKRNSISSSIQSASSLSFLHNNKNDTNTQNMDNPNNRNDMVLISNEAQAQFILLQNDDGNGGSIQNRRRNPYQRGNRSHPPRWSNYSGSTSSMNSSVRNFTNTNPTSYCSSSSITTTTTTTAAPLIFSNNSNTNFMNTLPTNDNDDEQHNYVTRQDLHRMEQRMDQLFSLMEQMMTNQIVLQENVKNLVNQLGEKPPS